MSEEKKVNEIPEKYHAMLQLEKLAYTESELKRKYDGIYNCFVKRLIDFVLALLAFVVFLPIYLVIAVCILLESGSPVLYCPPRGGYKGKTFRICKFRTMVKNADKIGGGTTALNDPRITRVGKILRKTKLDEFPQLINVIKGEMSFIGPRPELLKYTDGYQKIEKNILSVRPGITDISSITFINLDEIVGSNNADYMYEKYVLPRKNQLRLKYVAEVSLKTDMTLFFRTIFGVLRKMGRVFLKRSV